MQAIGPSRLYRVGAKVKPFLSRLANGPAAAVGPQREHRVQIVTDCRVPMVRRDDGCHGARFPLLACQVAGDPIESVSAWTLLARSGP